MSVCQPYGQEIVCLCENVHTILRWTNRREYIDTIRIFRCHLKGSKKKLREDDEIETEEIVQIPKWGLRLRNIQIFSTVYFTVHVAVLYYISDQIPEKWGVAWRDQQILTQRLSCQVNTQATISKQFFAMVDWFWSAAINADIMDCFKIYKQTVWLWLSICTLGKGSLKKK